MSTREDMVRACRRGGVEWTPRRLPGMSPWVLDGVRLPIESPNAVLLTDMARGSVLEELPR